MGKKLQTSNGFTLLEVLLVGSISIAVAGVVIASFFSGWQAQLSQEILSELQRSSRLTVDETNELIRSSTTAVSSVSDGAGSTYESGSSDIVLRLPPLSISGEILSSGNDYVIVRKNNTLIERIVIADAASVRATWPVTTILNKEAGSLEFQYVTAAGVELLPGSDDLSTARVIEIATSSNRTVSGREYSRGITGSALLRNRGI